MSEVPSRLNPRWKDVVLGKVTPKWKSLAVKLMMMRIVGETTADPSPMKVAKCVGEVYEYFLKNAATASADLAAIFN